AEQRQARGEQIQRTLVAATEVPLNTAALAGEVIQLARRIVDSANVNVLADVAAAAVSARAALEVAQINVEANLAAINDPSRGKAQRAPRGRRRPAAPSTASGDSRRPQPGLDGTVLSHAAASGTSKSPRP